MSTQRLPDERGAAGAEVVAVGVLVLVVGTLVMLGAWRVVDARLAATAGAREASRVLAESPTATATAVAAAREAVAVHGVAGTVQVDVAADPVRCGTATGVVVVTVPPVALPWVGGMGTVAVRSEHSEVVDPLAEAIAGEADCVG